MKPTAFLALSALACGIAQAAAAPDPALVRQGEYLARAGDCVACHTARDGKPFAGACRWKRRSARCTRPTSPRTARPASATTASRTLDRAVRHGVARSGDTLYPAMPYPSYARVSEADMRALYAYFMHGVEPVEQPNKASDIPWPLSMRWPLAFWRWTFAPEVKDFQAAAGQDPVLARGAYLVEGLGHCGACHTPRGLGMQEKALAARRWRGLPVRQRAAGELDRQEPARRPPDRTGQLERSRPGQLPAYRPQRGAARCSAACPTWWCTACST